MLRLGSPSLQVAIEDVRVFAREDMGMVTCVEVIDADDSAGRWSWLPLVAHSSIELWLVTVCRAANEASKACFAAAAAP